MKWRNWELKNKNESFNVKKLKEAQDKVTNWNKKVEFERHLKDWENNTSKLVA